MTERHRYRILRPFFISTRLMPAVTVADATINLRAIGIDRDDEHDPRVVWHYIIEAPDLLHAGHDLTTRYRGSSTVASQLPIAMGILLEHIGHLGEGDGHDDDRARPIAEWARSHLDDIEAVADLVDGARLPVPASVTWWAITQDADQTPYGRWCVGQATAHADRLATLNPRTTPAIGLVRRDEAWHDTALAWYTALTNRPEPESAGPTCAVAPPDAIVAWLRGPGPDPLGDTIADHLDLTTSGVIPDRVPDLVEQAQHAGVIGIPGHTIHAHPLRAETANGPTVLVTITTPNGTRLATTPLAVHANSRPDSGPYAVPDLLRRIAEHADDALAAPSSSTDPPARRASPFPRIELALATELPATITPPELDSRLPHSR